MHAPLLKGRMIRRWHVQSMHAISACETKWAGILIVQKSLELLTQQVESLCLLYCLQPVLHAQFREDVADMAFDGINDNDKVLRNLLVGRTACQYLQNPQFSLTQGLCQQ